MDLTPETLRSATFRDKLRGYHPEDVDEFLESVARGLEVLLARLRDASERARAAAAPTVPTHDADEAVRTLSLAQRTADLAIQEAKAEAERLLTAAAARARPPGRVGGGPPRLGPGPPARRRGGATPRLRRPPRPSRRRLCRPRSPTSPVTPVCSLGPSRRCRGKKKSSTTTRISQSCGA